MEYNYDCQKRGEMGVVLVDMMLLSKKKKLFQTSEAYSQLKGYLRVDGRVKLK
jgi:hypothetical protein